ncbi:MAG: hypothetical protein M3347_08155, partial [Armatimonadota bacterium]|nr:hypothetical protein [Armatimonadota bacterium]
MQYLSRLILILCCINLSQLTALAAEQPTVVEAIAGFWRGTLKVGPQTLAIVFQLERKPDGTLSGKLHSI